MTRRILYLENGSASLWTADGQPPRCLGEVLPTAGDGALRGLFAAHTPGQVNLVAHDDSLQVAIEALPPLARRERRQLAEQRCRKRFPQGLPRVQPIAGHPEHVLLTAWRESETEAWCVRHLPATGHRLIARYASCRLLPRALPPEAKGSILSRHRHGCQLALSWSGQIIYRRQLALPIDPDAWHETLQLIGQQCALLGGIDEASWLIDGSQVERLPGHPDIAHGAMLADCTPFLLGAVSKLPRQENYLASTHDLRRIGWLAGGAGLLVSALTGLALCRPEAIPRPIPERILQVTSPPAASDAAALSIVEVSPATAPTPDPALHGEIRFADGRRSLLGEPAVDTKVLRQLKPGDSVSTPLLPPGSLHIHRPDEVAR